MCVMIHVSQWYHHHGRDRCWIAIPGDIYTVWDHLLQSGDVCGVQKVPKRLMIVGKGLAVGDQGHLGYGQGGLDI